MHSIRLIIISIRKASKFAGKLNKQLIIDKGGAAVASFNCVENINNSGRWRNESKNYRNMNKSKMKILLLFKIKIKSKITKFQHDYLINFERNCGNVQRKGKIFY